MACHCENLLSLPPTLGCKLIGAIYGAAGLCSYVIWATEISRFHLGDAQLTPLLIRIIRLTLISLNFLSVSSFTCHTTTNTARQVRPVQDLQPLHILEKSSCPSHETGGMCKETAKSMKGRQFCRQPIFIILLRFIYISLVCKSASLQVC